MHYAQRAGDPVTAKPALAVVGATGAVGTVMLDLLSTRDDVWGQIRLVASPRSAGRRLRVRGQQTEVVALAEDVFDGVDVAMFDVPDEVSAHWGPIAAARGAVVVDNSGAFRMDPEVPLVVPEVNPHKVAKRPKGIIANPNCTTLSLIVAMAALHREFGLREMVVSSYQAASGAGQAGIDTLYAQLDKVAGSRALGQRAGDLRAAVGDLGPFPAPLALNVVPWAGSIKADGWSSEELKVRNESRKILGLPDLKVHATCVRVPVVTTHSVAVHAEFDTEVTREAAQRALDAAPGVVLYDDPERAEFPTPADVVGTDPTWVGRVRASLDNPRAVEVFVCGDNLRKGAALMLLVSNQRALIAACMLQAWKGSGKSWRTHGMLYLVAASRSRGLARAQSGHSMSSHSTMATRAPAGGLSTEGSWTWVPAGGTLGGWLNWARATGMSTSVAAARIRTATRAGLGTIDERKARATKRNMSIGRLPVADCNGNRRKTLRRY